jgi:hypothetical protein
MIPSAKFMIKTLAAIFLLAVGQPIFAQAPNTISSWTSSDGKTIKAKFVRIEEDSVVIEKEGKPFTIHFSKLAPASVELAKSLNEKITNNKGNEKVDIDPFSDPDLSRDSRITQGDSPGVAYIKEKLRRIVIPRIDFHDTTVEDAIDFFRMRSIEFDTLEQDPMRKGVKFEFRRSRSDVSNTDSLRVRELHIRNVPLAVALKYFCDQTKLRFKVDDIAVTLVPQAEFSEDITTRTFKVSPDFSLALSSDDGAPKNTARKRIMELLKNSGISFVEGASATLTNSGELIVTNTSSELDKIEQLVQAIESKPMQTYIKFRWLETDADTSTGILNEIKAKKLSANQLGEQIEQQIKNRKIKEVAAFTEDNVSGRKQVLRPKSSTLPLVIEAEPIWFEDGKVINLRASAMWTPSTTRGLGLLRCNTSTNLSSDRWHILSRWGDANKDSLLMVYAGSNISETITPQIKEEKLDDQLITSIVLDALLIETSYSDFAEAQKAPTNGRAKALARLIERSTLIASTTNCSASGSINCNENIWSSESQPNFPHGPGIVLKWQANVIANDQNIIPHDPFTPPTNNSLKEPRRIDQDIFNQKISLQLDATYVPQKARKDSQVLKYSLQRNDLQNNVPEFISATNLTQDGQRVVLLVITPWYDTTY